MLNRFGENIFFAQYIMAEKRKKRENRRFGPYIDSLPTKFDNFPVFFDEETVSYLDGTIL
jgi:hypothetical protein